MKTCIQCRGAWDASRDQCATCGLTGVAALLIRAPPPPTPYPLPFEWPATDAVVRWLASKEAKP